MSNVIDFEAARESIKQLTFATEMYKFLKANNPYILPDCTAKKVAECLPYPSVMLHLLENCKPSEKRNEYIKMFEEKMKKEY